MSGSPSPPLATLLLETAQIMVQVHAGSSLNVLLPRQPAAERAGVQALSFFAFRHLERGKALADCLLRKRPPNPTLTALLELSLSLLSARDVQALQQRQAGAAEPRAERLPNYEPHILVSQAVNAAGRRKALQPYKGLLNACLRRYLRESAQLLSKVWAQEEVRHDFPSWWIEALKQAYPQDWAAILQALNAPGPLSLRVNRRRQSRDDYLQCLRQRSIGARAAGQDGLILDVPQGVESLPGYEEGWFSVQDLAAQQAARLVPLNAGARVLDACAAPGGKTAHLLECADIHLTALDLDGKRLEKISENLQRLKLPAPGAGTIRILQADAARPEIWHDGRPFDLILADVPCTASGVVRRHPDIKYLRQPTDIAATAALQREIVRGLWQTLAPGGNLLYMTCSVFPQENEMQAEWFSTNLPQVRRLDAPGQILPGSQSSDWLDADGFFFALFKKDG